ncbi:hypothetical protein sos41_09600 [Alphaproteobacteria bacterium SO-S41]|nr:hypothetical protein sos41_09600 [Alphaproteobacteria bacterium SO-S41]
MSLVLVSLLAAAAANATPPAVFTLGGDTEALVLEKTVVAPENPGTDGGEAPPPVAPAVKKGTPYRAVTLSGIQGTFATSGDGKVGAYGCGEAQRAIVPFTGLPEGGAPYLLIPGAWAATPATVTVSDGAGAANEALVAKVMADYGMPDAKIVRGAKVEADIDGDGKPDTILNVTNAAEGAELTGNQYSALIAIMSNNGKEVSVPLMIQTSNTENPDPEGGPPVLLNIVAIADIDGDGKFELVTVGFGSEEHYVDVWSIAPDGTFNITYQGYCGV